MMLNRAVVSFVAGLILSGSVLSSTEAIAQPILEPGITFRVYDIGADMDRLYDLVPDQTPNVDERRDVIDFRKLEDFAGFAALFIVEVHAYLHAPVPGTYEFRVTSDDGSRLRINDKTVVMHDGVHPATSREGSVELEAGYHNLAVHMFENQGGEVLTVEWRPPNAADFEVIPANRLFTDAGVTRVTSPGQKQIVYPGGPRRPGDRLPLTSVHPGWTLETIRPDDFQPRCGGIAMMPGGRMAVTTFVPVNNGAFRDEYNGSLWILENITGDDPNDVNVIEVSNELHDPSGAIYHDGALYVCERNEVARFTDQDGDGIPESRETFASGWTSDNYHHFTFGLAIHDGFLYAALSTSIYFNNTIEQTNLVGGTPGLNGPNPPNRGACLKISLETGEVEYIAGGLRTPNGVGIGPDGQVFISDNQGAWNPSNSLYHIRPGHFYGHYNNTAAISDPYPNGGAPSLFSEHGPTSPAVHLPQNEIANSPTNPILIPDGPFAGQLYVGELTAGGIRRVFLEKINGVYQGAVFRFTQGFEAGVQRVVWGPEGCLYVGGQGAGGNWSWRGKQFGLQRLRPTGVDAFEMKAVRMHHDGFDIEFTKPVAPQDLADLQAYTVRQWTYEPTQDYGGAKVDEHELTVAAAVPSLDGRSVRLTIPGIKRGYVVYIRTNPTSASGEEIWSTETWYTVNAKPLPESARSLLKQDSLDGWHAVGGGTWTIENGVVTGRAEKSERRHGLLVSDTVHDDFVVEFDFRVVEGDSGFYFRVEERDDHVGVFGFQVEVDTLEPGGLYETNGRAWVIKPDREVAKRWHTPGEWNTVRLKAEGTNVIVQVNGEITARLENDEAGRRKGHFALQLHGGQDMFVQYRNIRIIESKP